MGNDWFLYGAILSYGLPRLIFDVLFINSFSILRRHTSIFLLTPTLKLSCFSHLDIVFPFGITASVLGYPGNVATIL